MLRDVVELIIELWRPFALVALFAVGWTWVVVLVRDSRGVRTLAAAAAALLLAALFIARVVYRSEWYFTRDFVRPVGIAAGVVLSTHISIVELLARRSSWSLRSRVIAAAVFFFVTSSVVVGLVLVVLMKMAGSAEPHGHP